MFNNPRKREKEKKRKREKKGKKKKGKILSHLQKLGYKLIFNFAKLNINYFFINI
jgi:hypothetical protein